MKIIYSFLIFGLIYSATIDPTQVIDIYYNVEYLLSQDLSKQFSYYPFRLPVIAGDKMDIEVRVPDDAAHNFYLEVYEYNYMPNDYQIYHHERGIIKAEGKVAITNYYREDSSTVYYYTFQVSPDATPGSYFSIYVTIPNYSYTYLYFKVNLSRYKYSNIKDLDFLNDYQIDTSIFGDRKIPYGYQIYIRLSSLSEDKMQIQLTTHEAYDPNTAFKVDVCQYNTKPVESQVYYGLGAVNCVTGLKNSATQKYKYYYDFQTGPNIEYISISIINYISDLDYLFIFIYTEKGMKAVIIALIILAPILIIAGIVSFILRRLGICCEGGGSYGGAPKATLV